MTPSRTSSDCPRMYIARESARWAIIGCSAPSIRHIIRRARATDTGRGVVGDLRREGPGGVKQLAGRVDAAHEATLQRLLRSEHAAGRDPLHRAADADDSGQEPARARLGNDPAAREDESVARALGSEPYVHRQGHRRADADRRAVDRPDDRLRAVEHPQREDAAVVSVVARDGLATAGVERLAAGREVGSGAVGAPRPGHDHRPDLVVRVGAVEGVQQLGAHRLRPRVQPVRPVEGDREDAVSQVRGDLFVGHCRDPNGSPRSRSPTSASCASASASASGLGRASGRPWSRSAATTVPRVRTS